MNRKLLLKGRTPRGEMNKLEEKYSHYLDEQKVRGIILFHAYEAISFRLAKNTKYTPDFYVVKADDLTVECHETKGFWLPEQRVRIKVAQDLNPYFKFIGVMWNKKKGGWIYEEFYR